MPSFFWNGPANKLLAGPSCDVTPITPGPRAGGLAAACQGCRAAGHSIAQAVTAARGSLSPSHLYGSRRRLTMTSRASGANHPLQFRCQTEQQKLERLLCNEVISRNSFRVSFVCFAKPTLRFVGAEERFSRGGKHVLVSHVVHSQEAENVSLTIAYIFCCLTIIMPEMPLLPTRLLHVWRRFFSKALTGFCREHGVPSIPVLLNG